MIIPDLLRSSPWRRHPEIDRLARLLLPPVDPNHQPGHPSLGAIWARELEQSAKAFEFGIEELEAADALGRSDRRIRHLYDTCQAPSPFCFFEWPDRGEGTHFGIFTEGDRSAVTITWLVRNNAANQVAPLMQVSLSFDVGYSSVKKRFFWSDCTLRDVDEPGSPPMPDRADVMLYSMVAVVWSFLGTPGVATVKETITREGRKAQKHGRFTLSAIHSYNKVTLNLPREIREGGRPIQFRPGPGKRYHDVMAFDRLKRAPPPGSPQLLRWLYAWWFGRVHVRAHHRGNPALGTVVKERRVTAK
jgi:hypothetical protein